ncbi:MAG: hypothetical protein KGQ16_06790 [Cyanobacteria bacterium REEB444]|nr:hypothetical protein [Cyanobacteria bacterium REEB444]
MNFSAKSIELKTYLLAATTVILVSFPGWAGEVYLNNHCQRVQPGKDTLNFRVDFRRNIESDGQRYWFAMARYADGAAIFCLTRPNYAQGKLIAVPQLQHNFIEEIKQENRESSFLVTVRHGNGWQVPMTQFRLNLDSPLQPKITMLKQWRDTI